MNARYAQAVAIVPEPCTILGTMLRPFSLGHHLLFRRLELPFVVSPLEKATTEQIHIGIAICGQSYNETLEQFLTGHWPRVFARWKRQLRGGWFGWRKPSKALLDEAEGWFRAYLQDGYEKPPIWGYNAKGARDGITLSAPWEVIFKNRLVIAGYSLDEIMNGYLPDLWYDYYAVSELRQADKCADPSKWQPIFYTKDDADRMAEMELLQQAACQAPKPKENDIC